MAKIYGAPVAYRLLSRTEGRRKRLPAIVYSLVLDDGGLSIQPKSRSVRRDAHGHFLVYDVSRKVHVSSRLLIPLTPHETMYTELYPRLRERLTKRGCLKLQPEPILNAIAAMVMVEEA